MTPSEVLFDFLQQQLGDGWLVQLDVWVDEGPGKRYAVLKPTGGPKAELVRRPLFTLSLIGTSADDLESTRAAAHQLVELFRTDSAGLVFVEAGEPAFVPSSDNRPIYDIALAAITN